MPRNTNLGDAVLAEEAEITVQDVGALGGGRGREVIGGEKQRVGSQIGRSARRNAR